MGGTAAEEYDNRNQSRLRSDVFSTVSHACPRKLSQRRHFAGSDDSISVAAVLYQPRLGYPSLSLAPQEIRHGARILHRIRMYSARRRTEQFYCLFAAASHF